MKVLLACAALLAVLTSPATLGAPTTPNGMPNPMPSAPPNVMPGTLPGGSVGVDPATLQQQQMPMQEEEQREERAAETETMSDSQHALVHQCRQQLQQQAKFPGTIKLLSISLAEHADGAYFKGRFTEGAANGQLQTLHFRCLVSADKGSVAGVEVTP